MFYLLDWCSMFFIPVQPHLLHVPALPTSQRPVSIPIKASEYIPSDHKWSPTMWIEQQAFYLMGISMILQETDLVPTDIVAGLVLVQQQQVEIEHQLTSVMVRSLSPSGHHSQVTQQLHTVDGDLMPQPKDWMTVIFLSYAFLLVQIVDIFWIH